MSDSTPRQAGGHAHAQHPMNNVCPGVGWPIRRLRRLARQHAVAVPPKSLDETLEQPRRRPVGGRFATSEIIAHETGVVADVIDKLEGYY